jgi:uncharacterized protein YaaQ
MKLLIVILRDGDAGAVTESLVTRGYRVTRIASTGGFLRRGNVTLLIGAEAEEVDEVINLLRQTCTSPEPGEHRATIFVVDASHFEQV